DIVDAQGLQIGIIVDVQAIIPEHKLIAIDLPKAGERHQDQEGHHNMRCPGTGSAVGGSRTGGKALVCPVCAVSHCGSLGLSLQRPSRQAGSITQNRSPTRWRAVQDAVTAKRFYKNPCILTRSVL